MNRNKTLLIFGTLLLLVLPANAGDDFLTGDYKLFGRKDPMSLGSFFSTLGTHSIFMNPANIALVTDNQISFGGGISDIGDGEFCSWMAPNLSISSSFQTVEPGSGASDSAGFRHEKQVLHFTFGLSTKDLGLMSEKYSAAVGLAVKRQADRLLNGADQTVNGGNAVSLDLGFLLLLKKITFELAMMNINSPRLSHSDVSYSGGFMIGTRFTTAAGLTIALQGIGGKTYADSDFGFNLGVKQGFFKQRLVSQIQLTSFFLASEATMQNVCLGVGYRLDPKLRLPAILKDMEFSYALSFLAMPKTVGTHLVAVTNYF